MRSAATEVGFEDELYSSGGEVATGDADATPGEVHGPPVSRIIVVTSSVEFEERVRRAYPARLTEKLRYWRDGLPNGDPSRVVDELVERDPDVVAVGPDVAVGSALELARAFDYVRPAISVVIVAEPSPALLEAALRVAAREVIAPDAADDVMHDALERALEAARRRRVTLEGRAGALGPSRRVISVLCPKGGTGKTTVATNLALGLARAAPGEVLIVDFDLYFGDVATALGLAPKRTVADVPRSTSALDVTAAKLCLTHHPSNLYALCGPLIPTEAEDLTAEHVAHILRILVGEFRYVVIDTATGIGDVTLGAIEASTDLVLLSATDVPSVWATRKEVEMLQTVANPNQRWHFVLNRADARTGLGVEDIEAAVDLRTDVSIPSSRTVPVSLNEGVPVLESDPRSPAARAMVSLVARFLPAPVSSAAEGPAGLRRRKATS